MAARGSTHDLVVAWEHPLHEPGARALAARLGLPAVEAGPDLHVGLVWTGVRLELRTPEGGAVFADFVEGPMGFRCRQGGRNSDPLVRAVLGSRPTQIRTVLDATAGLGRDAVTLALAGLTVTACERSRAVAALLADGLCRAHAADPALATVLETRLTVIVGGAERQLERLSDRDRPDVVYLDPMHPPRRKSAQVRKEMRALRYLLPDGGGDESDGAHLLERALAAANHRVVVKRPRLAAPLPGPPPPHQLPGKRVRFDVYPVEHGRFTTA